jgi:uncharacterized protein (DUF362 family)
MEGNGPIQGAPVPLGAIVMGRDLPAVDATCARLMHLDPAKMDYLTEAHQLGLGQIDPNQIHQRGESLTSLARPFAVLPRHKSLRLPS